MDHLQFDVRVKFILVPSDYLNHFCFPVQCLILPVRRFWIVRMQHLYDYCSSDEVETNWKMKKVFVSVVVAFVGVAGLFSGCKHEPEIGLLPPPGGGGGTDTTWVNPDPCDPDSVYFTNTILPLLVSSCAQTDCHDAITHEEGVEMYDYAHIMDEVTPGNPWNSELVEAITETDMNDVMPPTTDGGPLSQEQIDLIVTWISQGALNNACVADCDPNATITFAGTILPLMENACQGCHSGANPDGNLSLVSYSDISANALSGDMMNSLLGTNGFSLMPNNTTGIPQCNIDQIQTWIDAGAPQN